MRIHLNTIDAYACLFTAASRLLNDLTLDLGLWGIFFWFSVHPTVLEFKALSEFGEEPAAELLTRGFADYFVRISFTGAALVRMVKTDSLGLDESRIAILDGNPVGVALIARRGDTSRLAGMAIVEEARSKGIGQATMDRLITEARQRGDRKMILEVSTEMSRPFGFMSVRALGGFAGSLALSMAASSRRRRKRRRKRLM